MGLLWKENIVVECHGSEYRTLSNLKRVLFRVVATAAQDHVRKVETDIVANRASVHAEALKALPEVKVWELTEFVHAVATPGGTVTKSVQLQPPFRRCIEALKDKIADGHLEIINVITRSFVEFVIDEVDKEICPEWMRLMTQAFDLLAKENENTQNIDETPAKKDDGVVDCRDMLAIALPLASVFPAECDEDMAAILGAFQGQGTDAVRPRQF